jgi:preprotein translocase subunit SecA
VTEVWKENLFLTDGEHFDKINNTSVASLRERSPSSRNRVRHEIGTAFDFKSECCSTSSESAPEAISPERRETIIVHIAAGLMGAYRYFRQSREVNAATAFKSDTQRTASKVGRNEPCPCGSGKKYKKCCGGVTVN